MGRGVGVVMSEEQRNRIREMLSENKTAAEISKEVGCSTSYVYNRRHEDAGKRKKKMKTSSYTEIPMRAVTTTPVARANKTLLTDESKVLIIATTINNFSSVIERLLQ